MPPPPPPAPLAIASRTPTLEQRLAERERPDRPAFGFQRWDHLLFLHWQYDADAIQRTLPPGLTVDTFDNRAYLGIVPFYMRRIRPPFLPPVPWISYFLELNLRTYVHDAAGRPGIWFYSLDCNRALAVWVARWRFHLPYEHAALSAREDPATGTIDYTHQRRGDHRRGDVAARATPGRYTYRPSGPASPAVPGSLEFFLAERYRLFARHRDGRLLTASVHHPPYPLSTAEVTAHDARVIELAGFAHPGRPPELAHYARRVDVTVFKISPSDAPTDDNSPAAAT